MRLAARLASIPVMLILSGCSVFTALPQPKAVDQRLAAFPTDDLPLERPVTVRWDPHMVPYIEAETDRDLAFALGLVHAHLRLAQMDLLRRVAQGRVAEMAGPLAADIDHSLRILDYGRAADEIVAQMPSETRAWLEAFVEGVNHYQSRLSKDELPHEYAVLGMEREPWAVRDLLTVGRLAGTDVNWLVWFRLLQLRDHDDWPQIWRRLVENGTASFLSFEGGDHFAALDGLLGGNSRSGSNAVAVSGAKSATGSALLATDPHLGIQLPNLWLIAGIKSPGYHAVGFMVPGLPFLAIGRNADIAWSGTNMRAASSDLYDVSWMEPSGFETRTETVRVRWWFDREITVRNSPYGPVISDAPALGLDGGDSFALKWIGHQPTDEVTAMLEVARASNFAQFRAAFDSFAVSAQNMIYADKDGNIGQVMATHLPKRRNGPVPEHLVLDPRKERNLWNGILTATELPATYNPAKGFLASANNRPTELAVSAGYFFSPDDRVVRMRELMSGDDPVTVDDLAALQRDVYMPSAAALRDALVGRIDGLGVVPATGGEAELLALMRDWDGHYAEDSRGAVAFELFFNAFAPAFYTARMGEEAARAFTGAARVKSLLAEDLEQTDAAVLAGLLQEALAEAAADLSRFDSWGDMHRLALGHPLSNAPLIGGKYRFGNYPIGGSTDTLMKTAHDSTDQRHDTRYGSQARFIADMADPDGNYFVLLGGQDGWINSGAFMDQVPMWLTGDYVRVPMSTEAVRETFPRAMTLRPAEG